ncbi:hypothetical protein DFH07DRAFT_765006 [Mycena maculata]|uniref:Uncharacterized protein n=1 Tax=Mycena maculata TaxID=230809 RepID=A0AAD7KCV7_9AGAR|nr:hypothetical protein DFH07DRAFT_765006 [Mycena maculata]
MKAILLANAFLAFAVSWVVRLIPVQTVKCRRALRIKVKQAQCADRVASVTLRLQLDEFGEVKHFRRGAALPEIQKSNNQTVPTDFLGFFGGHPDDVVYDYSAYDGAMSDPNVWVVKAEERTAWSTEVVLFENNPNFSQPMVAPFVVAPSPVNYSPAIEQFRSLSSSTPITRMRMVTSDITTPHNLIYGRRVDVPGGHTNFVPKSTPLPQNTFAWNVTFAGDEFEHHEDMQLPANKKRSADRQRCLPEWVLVAEVTLKEGDVIRGGQTLKGKLTVHATNVRHFRDFRNTLELSLGHRTGHSTSNRCPGLLSVLQSWGGGIEPPTHRPLLDAAICISGMDTYIRHEGFGDDTAADDTAKTEEGLWDACTRVGQPVHPQSYSLRSLRLSAQVPIIVLGDMSDQLIEHYLKSGSGLPSPIILASRVDTVFLVARPVTIVEPSANTSARLMQSEGIFDPYKSRLNFWNQSRSAGLPPTPLFSIR